MSHLYYCNANGKVSLAVDGVLRSMHDPEVYGRLFAGPIDPAKMTRYDSVAPIAEGQPLSVKAKLIRSSDDPAVYLLDDEGGLLVRRHVVSAEMFVELGLDWSKIEVQSPSQVNQVPLGRPCSLEKPGDALALTFYSYNPVYQAQDGKPYTLSVTDSAGRQVYSRSGTTNAGLDTYYGTTWGRDTVNMTIGQTYTISVVATNGGDVYEWTSAGFGVRRDMDPNIKILHNAYIQTGVSKALTFYCYNPVYQAQDGKPYTITITDSSGRQIYSHSGTTDAGLDTYYGTTWGRDTVNMTIGHTYTINVVATNGGDVYEWISTGFGVHRDMDPNIKIIHNAYTRRK